QTEPEAFTLSLFLNAQIAPTTKEPKPKGTNVLVPTSLVYPGGLREFSIDMGPEFVTRLVVIQGNFKHLTLAVYGDSVSEPLSEPSSYEPSLISLPPRTPLSSSMDLSNISDPCFPARELLKLIPTSTPLCLITRLILCLKSQDDAWETIKFAELTEFLETPDLEPGLEWLQRAAELFMLPVAAEIDDTLLTSFTNKLSQSLVEKTNDHAYALAGLLRRTSAQPTKLVGSILGSLNLEDSLNPALLDKHTVERLYDAAANPIIADALDSEHMSNNIRAFKEAHSSNHAAKTAATNLETRLQGWAKFDKVINGQCVEINGLLEWLKELTSDDMSCGVFLCWMIQEDMLSKLKNLPTSAITSTSSLWSNGGLSSSDFSALLRSLLGICFTLVVFCWAEDVSATASSERILAMIRLWQETEGYQEIVNHGLLLGRILYRLESILRSDAPAAGLSVMNVEQILRVLCTYPTSMIRAELAPLVEAIPIYGSSLLQSEQAMMQDVVTVSSYGLSQAILTIMDWPGRDIVSSDSYVLQAALLIIANALEDRESGEWTLLQTSWKENVHGLVYQLVELLGQVVVPIQEQFSLSLSSLLHLPVLTRLLSIAGLLLKILSRLIPSDVLPTRLVRKLAHDITNLFIIADMVDSACPQGNSATQVALSSRPICADTLSILCMSSNKDVTGQTVLQMLFHTSLYPENDDPTVRLEQGFYLLDLLLPISVSEDRIKERYWTQKVLPSILPDLGRFFRVLTVEHKVQLVKRLGALDRHEIGLMAWFIEEESRILLKAIESWRASPLLRENQRVQQVQAISSLQFLVQLMEASTGDISPDSFLESSTAQMVSQVFSAFAESHQDIPGLFELATSSAPYSSRFGRQGRIDIAIILLRNRDYQPSAFIQAADLLSLAGRSSEEHVNKVLADLGAFLQRLSEGDLQSEWSNNDSLPRAVVASMLWVLDQKVPDSLQLCGISKSSFMSIIPRISKALPDEISFLSEVEARITFSEDVPMQSVKAITDEPFTVPFNQLCDLLS
ncbi:hypothetical protein M422DRAFT_33774, partial [Sphaerobolus stellatus SS14]